MNASDLPCWDWAVLAIYLTGLMGLGLVFGRRNITSDHFMRAGGRVPGWAVGLSIFGTYVSSISFLALPGKAVAENWNALVFSLSLPVAAWVATRWFVPFYRAEGEVSAYHHLEARFGAWARSYAALCYVLTQLARMGTILYLVALALAPLTGWDVRVLIVLTGLVTLFYAWTGGVEAVIWADVVQSIVLLLGAICCAWLLLVQLPGGVKQFCEVAVDHGKFGLGSFSLALSEPTFWVVLLYGLFINLQNFGIDQNYVQRYVAAESETAARRSVWLSAWLYLPTSALFLLIGTALFVRYTVQPELWTAAVPWQEKPDLVFPHFLRTGLPAGFTGLVIAALFAAAQSTLSSSMNGCATLTLCDGYRRYLRPHADDRESLRVLRAATLFHGFVGIGVALAMTRVRSALDAWWELASVFSGGMLGLFLLGQITTRSRKPAAATGVLAGVFAIGWVSLSRYLPDQWGAWRSQLHPFLAVVLGTLTIFFTGLLLSRRQSQSVSMTNRISASRSSSE
ncbi:MAG: sodium:solute symporter [Verrucomicrobiota bacterium]|nr:sodium:solute symporter [Limisphaera sp.]MDW8382073.1 sodium:solute symporter [Verrucomicrobiota bacterium]